MGTTNETAEDKRPDAGTGESPKNEKFTGACTELKGKVFTLGPNRSARLATFNDTMESMKRYIGQKYDTKVLETIEMGVYVDYDEPDAKKFVNTDGTVSEDNKITYSMSIDNYMSNQEKLIIQRKQVFSLFLGQVDENIKLSMEKHPDWKTIYSNKNLLRLIDLLQNFIYNYKSNQDSTNVGLTPKEVNETECTTFSSAKRTFESGSIHTFLDISSEIHALTLLNHGGGTSDRQSSFSRSDIPDTWILLDSQSTVDLFSNKKLLKNIHRISTTLYINCNAGVKTTNLRGELPGYGMVWYYPQGIANILSLSRVKEKYRVTYDSASDNVFHVHKPDRILKFREATRRLYYFDLANRYEESTVMIQTVDENKTKFSAYDFKQAKLARTIQKRIGRPGLAHFINIVRTNQIPNCPITVQDIKNAEFIWGPELGCLKGKTVRRQPPTVSHESYNIPIQIMQQYRHVTLSADVMFVQRIPFLMTISKHIKFGTAGKLEKTDDAAILLHFKNVLGLYCGRGFKVTIILADNQFESMRGELADMGALLNIVAADEHVPDIERYNRTIKDRVRASYNMLPFEVVPPVFIPELVYASVFWRNMFALKGGISQTESPSQIVLNRKLDYNSHCKVEFGDYVQTHEEHDNSMQTRTIGAIATRPSGNAQGGYYFISLSSGRRIHRYDWTPLPMPNEVIDQVHRLARRAKANKELTFTNLKNEDLDVLYANLPPDDDEEETDVIGNLPNEIAGVGEGEMDDEDSDDEDYTPEDEDEDEADDGSDEDSDEEDGDESASEEDDVVPGVEQQETPGVDDQETPGVDETTGVEEQELPEMDDDDDEEQENAGVANNEEPVTRTYNIPTDSRSGIEGLRMNLREQPRRNYVCVNNASDEPTLHLKIGNQYKLPRVCSPAPRPAFMFHQLGINECFGMLMLQFDNDDNLLESDIDEYDMEYIFLTEQMNWKKGLKIFKEKGEEAISKELQQIHDMEGFQPKHWDELTKEERAKALKYLMYIKEKRDGKVKGRGCADGRSQRLYTPKNEASSPTVSLPGLIMTCVIDAFEKRDVATVDIPGAFLQTKMPEDEEDVHVIIEGRMAELLAKISPETYQEYVANRRGQAYIYCKLNVALYGTLKAALLFWKNLSGCLKDDGFKINPYDWCVANKMINGKQCTIVWHVDDLKISHVDSKVVSHTIDMLEEKYGKVNPLTVRRGKIHDYLGMELDFSKPNKVMVNMEEYIDEVLAHVPEDMSGTATTPAADHLFKTRDDAEKLDEDTAELFHRITAQLLFLCKRGRPDIQTAVSFLCKRVKCPDIDDYKKLARVIRYLRRTKFLRLTLQADQLDQNEWFIDGSFAVHNDMKSHTGSFMTFGKGMMDGGSTSQKINTTSSTEAEVVAVHDTMPSILWTRYFLEAQGYPLKPSIIHQDNQSAMLLENNGRASSGKRTRHMNIRYFFVADCIQRGHVEVKYLPTDDMVADFFTKPLQGIKFRKLRNIIMNCEYDEFGPVNKDGTSANAMTDDDSEATVDSVNTEVNDDASQECVGDTICGKKVTWADVVSRIPKSFEKWPMMKDRPPMRNGGKSLTSKSAIRAVAE